MAIQMWIVTVFFGVPKKDLILVLFDVFKEQYLMSRVGSNFLRAL